MSDDKAHQNTDREIYRERPGDYYADSIHVTERGSIGINCGGFVIVLPLRTWHALASGAKVAPPEAGRYTKEQVIAAYEAGVSSGGGWSDPWKESSVQEERDRFVTSLEPQPREGKEGR